MSESLVPNEGDRVLIECDGQQWQAIVGKKSPRGDFTVSWYGGRNRFAPWLPGHWYTEFGPNGEPKHGWRIVAILGPEAEEEPEEP